MVTIESRSTNPPQDSDETGSGSAPEQPENGNTRSGDPGNGRPVSENSNRLEKFQSALEQFKNTVEDKKPKIDFNEPGEEDNDPSVHELRSIARKLAPARPRKVIGSGPPVRHVPYTRTNGRLPFFAACLAVLMIGGPIFIGPLLLLDRQTQTREAETSQNLPHPAQNPELNSVAPDHVDTVSTQHSSTDGVISPMPGTAEASTDGVSRAIPETAEASTDGISRAIPETAEASTDGVISPMPEPAEASTDGVSSPMPEITEGSPVFEQRTHPNSTIALVPATGGLGFENETENTPFVVNHSAAAVIEPVSENALQSKLDTLTDEARSEPSSADRSDTASDDAGDSMITGAIPKDILPDNYEKGQIRQDIMVTTASTPNVEGLLARGHKKLLRGEITAARSLFHRAYKLGDSRGAEGMGMTFDPEVYENIPVAMFSPEVERARYWYEKSRLMSANEKHRSDDDKN